MKIVDFKAWLKEYESSPCEKMLRKSFGDKESYRMIGTMTLINLQEPLWDIYIEETKVEARSFKERYELFEKEIIEYNISPESERILKIMEQKLETNAEAIKKYIKDINNLQNDYFNELKKMDGDKI